MSDFKKSLSNVLFQLANRTLVWPKQLEAFGLNPDKYQQWEDNTRAEFQTAVELKVASGDHLYLPWALGRETIAVDVKVGQRALRWVQYLRIDAFGDSHPCAASGINLELQARLDALLPETPSKDLIEYTMATIYTADKESKTKVDWRVIYNRALERLWDDIEGWNALEAESAARKTDVEFLKTLGTLRQSWPGNYNQTDRYRERRRGRFAAGQNLLYMMPEDTILWLVDKNGKTFGFHHPTAIQEAYGDEAVKRIFSNIETYFSVEPPRLPDAHRHPFHKEFLTANPQFQKDNGGFSGCAHIGHWHMTGYEDSEVSPDAIRTKDSRPASAHAEKLLHQLLKHACGHVTRVVDRWFGVVDPVLRARYKRVYKESSEYCGLPTSEEEIACLRAFLLRVQTESHTDLRDWKHGYAWMTPFGDFTGKTLAIAHLSVPSIH